MIGIVSFVRNSLAASMAQKLNDPALKANREARIRVEVSPEIHRAVWSPLNGLHLAISEETGIVVVEQWYMLRRDDLWHPLGWMEKQADRDDHPIQTGAGFWPDGLSWRHP